MATTDSPTEPLPEGGGIDEQGLELLAATQLNSFTAQPSTITPFGPGATLRWDVTAPERGVRIFINDAPVAKSGTMLVHPLDSTLYQISARTVRLAKPLGSVFVRVESSACITSTVPESAIRARIRQSLDEFDQAASQFRQRSPASVEIDAQGIRIGFRAELAVPNFPDPNVDVDMVLGLRVRDGAVEAYYKSFAIGVSWPWWVTAITAGASRILEEFIDGKLNGAMKPLLLSIVQQQLDAYVRQLPGNLRLHTIVPRQDAISVTACPAGVNAPFMVVG